MVLITVFNTLTFWHNKKVQYRDWKGCLVQNWKDIMRYSAYFASLLRLSSVNMSPLWRANTFPLTKVQSNRNKTKLCLTALTKHTNSSPFKIKWKHMHFYLASFRPVHKTRMLFFCIKSLWIPTTDVLYAFSLCMTSIAWGTKGFAFLWSELLLMKIQFWDFSSSFFCISDSVSKNVDYQAEADQASSPNLLFSLLLFKNA